MTLDHFVLEGLKNFWNCRFTRQRYPEFFNQLTYDFQRSNFSNVISKPILRLWLRSPENFVIQTKRPLEFSKKVRLGSCPPVGHTVDLNYRGIQQFRIRQTNDINIWKHLVLGCFFFLSAVYSLFIKLTLHLNFYRKFTFKLYFVAAVMFTRLLLVSLCGPAPVNCVNCEWRCIGVRYAKC